MYLSLIIQCDFDAEKEEPYIKGKDGYPPLYFPTDMMRDGLNDYLCELGLGIGFSPPEYTSVWSDWFMEEYGFAPTLRFAYITEHPIPTEQDRWIHDSGIFKRGHYK